jgi:hypothetical protein
MSRASLETTYPGSVELGFYMVEDGFVNMCDEDGNLTGKNAKLAKGDDPKVVAGRLTKEAYWSKRANQSTFNRPLHYPKSWNGVA